MTDPNKRENIALELSKAEAALSSCSVLRQAGDFDGAMSRAYYAVFHFARALILMEGLEAKTHTGVGHLVNLHFVRSGRLDANVATFLAQLAGLRQEADYDTASMFTDVSVTDALQKAEQYREAVRAILSNGGYLSPG